MHLNQPQTPSTRRARSSCLTPQYAPACAANTLDDDDDDRVGSVQQKMEMEGLDPELIHDPEAPSPNGNAVAIVEGGGDDD